MKKKGILLEGGNIPIKFNNRTSSLGMFSIEKPDFCFYFSRYYFDDENMPEEVIKDVIRHEYAHYYAYCVFGSLGHNKYWRAACQVVGANSSRLCTDDFINRQREVEAKQNCQYLSRLKNGDSLIHKTYGGGVIETKLYHDTAIHTVLFEHQLTKKLDERWMLQNCEIKKGRP